MKNIFKNPSYPTSLVKFETKINNIKKEPRAELGLNSQNK